MLDEADGSNPTHVRIEPLPAYVALQHDSGLRLTQPRRQCLHHLSLHPGLGIVQAPLGPPCRTRSRIRRNQVPERSSTGGGIEARRAFVEHLEWCDQAFACGPNAMLQAMAEALRRSRPPRADRPVQVLLEERMGCGTGLCYGCAVETRRGMRLVCKDGPRFELREVFG